MRSDLRCWLFVRYFTPEMHKDWDTTLEKEFGHDPDLLRWSIDGDDAFDKSCEAESCE